MRNACSYVFIIACVPTFAGMEAPTLDQPRRGLCRFDDVRALDPCDAGAAVGQIARWAGIPAGFENTPNCWLGPHGEPGDHYEVLTDRSPRQVLDHLMTRMPNYSWREMNGIVVVRPKDAWDNPANVLNLPAKPFVATNMPLEDVLHTALRAVTPSAFIPHEDVPQARPVGLPLTVRFNGGTMLDAVNAVVRTRGDVEWQIGYGGGRGTIVLNPFDRSGVVAIAPVAIPQQQQKE